MSEQGCECGSLHQFSKAHCFVDSRNRFADVRHEVGLAARLQHQATQSTILARGTNIRGSFFGITCAQRTREPEERALSYREPQRATESNEEPQRATKLERQDQRARVEPSVHPPLGRLMVYRQQDDKQSAVRQCGFAPCRPCLVVLLPLILQDQHSGQFPAARIEKRESTARIENRQPELRIDSQKRQPELTAARISGSVQPASVAANWFSAQPAIDEADGESEAGGESEDPSTIHELSRISSRYTMLTADYSVLPALLNILLTAH